MALIDFRNQSDGTLEASSQMKSNTRDDYPANVRVMIWGDFGGGTVTIEVKMPDDSWVAFPELTFTEISAKSVELFEFAELRAVVAGCTDVSVYVDR